MVVLVFHQVLAAHPLFTLAVVAVVLVKVAQARVWVAMAVAVMLVTTLIQMIHRREQQTLVVVVVGNGIILELLVRLAVLA
jgi:hypothetical protein